MLDCLAPILNPIARILMGTRGVCLVPVILSCVGGYPVGAKATATMKHNGAIGSDEAEKLSCICCAAGPGFLVTFVGISLLSCKDSGIILLSSQIISVIVLSLLSRLIFGSSQQAETSEKKPVNPDFCRALVGSVNSAVKSTAGMCGFVIGFCIICEVLTQGLAFNNTLGKAVISLLEITSGISRSYDSLSLELISALTGFGGVCVHLQIFRELNSIKFSKIRFYLFRFVQASCCFVTTKVLVSVFPPSQDVFSTVSAPPRLTFYSSVIGSAALLVTSIAFILTLRKKHI